MQKKMRLFLLILLLLGLALCLVSCGNCEKGHQYGEATVLEAATCTTEGKQSESCKRCGADNVTLIPIQPHTPGAFEVSYLATPLSAGREEQHCTVCGKLLDARIISVDYLAAEGMPADTLPSTLNYDGTRVNVLCWNDAPYPEFELQTKNGDSVDLALEARNKAVEERLGVDLVWIGHAGNSANASAFIDKLVDNYLIDLRAYDIIAGYSGLMGRLTVLGYLCDYSIIKQNYLDFSKPWWPEKMLDSMMYLDSYFAITGDISTNTFANMNAVYFNKTLLESSKRKSPYEDVYDGTWTVDRLIAITADSYGDTDAVRGFSVGDRYGFVSTADDCEAFWAGAGLHYLDNSNKNGKALHFSKDYTSDRAGTVIDALKEWVKKESFLIFESGTTKDFTASDVMNNFGGGNSLFLLGNVGMAKTLAHQSVDMGLLPMPKGDEAQETYYTGMGNYHTYYGICYDFEVKTKTLQSTLSLFSAVLEGLASESYRQVMPVLTQEALSALDADSHVMYAYIRNGKIFDQGRLYTHYFRKRLCSEPVTRSILGYSHWKSIGYEFVDYYSIEMRELREDLELQHRRDK